jgi:hypothetical protein
MTEPRNDDRSQARREAAALLNVDIDHMSPADGLRVDMVSALRLVIDHEQSCVLSGGSADLGKLNVAVQSLIALLPGRELPEPESQREDPRQVMWEIYKQMRERGEISLKVLPPDDGHFQHRIAELEAENERLRETVGMPPVTSVPRGERAITPPTRDIVPPCERAECDAGPRPGPDDPPTLRTIEAKAVRLSPTNPPNPPAASAARPSRPQNWDDTPGGKAWRAWVDSGSAHYDRWSNRNE